MIKLTRTIDKKCSKITWMDTKKSLLENHLQRESNIIQIIDKSNPNGVQHVNDPMRYSLERFAIETQLE